MARVRSLVLAHPDCFERTCLPGHVTASAWILDASCEHFLLTHHAKLDRWLQLGGHADGDPRVEAVALREAREESGMEDFDWVRTGGELLPVDVDVHDIPAAGGEPRHQHHDVRFVLVAAAGQSLRRSDESKDLRWFERVRLAEVVDEPSILRMARKADGLLRAAGRRLP